MKNQKIWKNILENYQNRDLDKKPSIFAQEVIEYFKGKNTLLDLGAGLGQDSRYFVEEGFSVTSTDASEYALDFAKEKNVHGKIKFLQVDLEKKFPFADESFDVVYAHLSLHYFDNEKTREIFKEIHRILKKGGVFASLFNTIKDPEIKEEQFKKIEENYYQEGDRLKKRYFCVECLEKYTKDLFETVLSDNKGKTYKDEIESLIRFVGVKK